MALDTKRKNRLRYTIRVTMVTVAIVLLFFAVVIPIINNAIALGIEKELKHIPLPRDTVIIESTSAAGKLTGNGNGMQYFGAVLLKSDCSLEELYNHYRPYRQGLYDCLVEPQTESMICPSGETIRNGATSLSFRNPIGEQGYYILYSWGDAPAWSQDLLDTDLRGH